MLNRADIFIFLLFMDSNPLTALMLDMEKEAAAGTLNRYMPIYFRILQEKMKHKKDTDIGEAIGFNFANTDLDQLGIGDMYQGKPIQGGLENLTRHVRAIVDYLKLETGLEFQPDIDTDIITDSDNGRLVTDFQFGARVKMKVTSPGQGADAMLKLKRHFADFRLYEELLINFRDHLFKSKFEAARINHWTYDTAHAAVARQSRGVADEYLVYLPVDELVKPQSKGGPLMSQDDLRRMAIYLTYKLGMREKDAYFEVKNFRVPNHHLKTEESRLLFGCRCPTAEVALECMQRLNSELEFGVSAPHVEALRQIIHPIGMLRRA